MAHFRSHLLLRAKSSWRVDTGPFGIGEGDMLVRHDSRFTIHVMSGVATQAPSSQASGDVQGPRDANDDHILGGALLSDSPPQASWWGNGTRLEWADSTAYECSCASFCQPSF